MIREEYLSSEYTSEDKKLIVFFQKQTRKINQLFHAALLEGNKTKAHLYLRKIQAINRALKAEYGERAQYRIPEEYLKGGLYIDDHLNHASTLSRIKSVDKDLMMSHVAQFGPLHTEAVKALIDNSKMLVSASIDGMEKVASSMLSKHQQSQARIKLAQGVLSGDGLEKMKKNLTQMFENKGVAKFQDRAGRMRDINRYVDMLTRTETKIANTQGTINRALENGITKFEVVEHENCCDICAQHNGKVYDISKGAIELVPYHPNCKGYIVPIVDLPESKFGYAIDLKVKNLADKAGIEGKNTLERMKKLNKFVKTKQGGRYKEDFYKIKDDAIIADLKRKEGRIVDKGKKKTTYKIKQGKVAIDWHLGGSYDKFKELGLLE